MPSAHALCSPATTPAARNAATSPVRVRSRQVRPVFSVALILLKVPPFSRDSNNNPVLGATSTPKSAATEAWASVASLRAGEGTRTLDVHLGNRLAFDLDWPSCIPNAVESTEVVLFVPYVSPYFRTRYGSWEGVVNETQPGEAGAWPGRVVVRDVVEVGRLRIDEVQRAG